MRLYPNWKSNSSWLFFFSFPFSSERLVAVIASVTGISSYARALSHTHTQTHTHSRARTCTPHAPPSLTSSSQSSLSSSGCTVCRSPRSSPRSSSKSSSRGPNTATFLRTTFQPPARELIIPCTSEENTRRNTWTLLLPGFFHNCFVLFCFVALERLLYIPESSAPPDGRFSILLPKSTIRLINFFFLPLLLLLLIRIDQTGTHSLVFWFFVHRFSLNCVGCFIPPSSTCSL